MLGVLILVSACGSWPPYEAKARQHFEKNRESFERLAEKMRGTDFWRVSVHRQTSVEVTPIADGDHDRKFIIDDDPEWRELLFKVGMYMVLQYDGAIWTDDLGTWGKYKNRIETAGFAHSPTMLEKFKVCLPEFKRIPCGRCAVPLTDNWYIHYEWHPGYYSEEEWDSYLAGETTLEEYSESRDKANRQCHLDGYAEMGYDVDRIFNRQGN